MRAQRAILVSLGLCVALAAVPTVASASIGLGAVVSANPANVTPNVASGAVYKLLQAGGTMYAGGAFSSVSTPAGVSPGGTFPGKLRAVSPASGANTGYLDLGISGSVTSNAGPVEVYRFAVNPAGTRLVAVGNFTTVGGQTRYRAFMLTLGATASLNAWYYPPLQNLCRASSLPDYLRDVDFSPDGSWFAVVSTGYIPRTGGSGATCATPPPGSRPPCPTRPGRPGSTTPAATPCTRWPPPTRPCTSRATSAGWTTPRAPTPPVPARSAAPASAPSTRPPAWPCPGTRPRTAGRRQ